MPNKSVGNWAFKPTVSIASTFTEAVAKTASLGLRYLEFFPGQSLSKEKPDIKTDISMTPEIRNEVKKILADAGVSAVSYGVCPAWQGRSRIEKNVRLCQGYGPGDSGSPSRPRTLLKPWTSFARNTKSSWPCTIIPRHRCDWNYKTVLEACQGLQPMDRRLCRYGPLDAIGHQPAGGSQGAGKGRIVSFHLKVRNKYGKQGSFDVPWGTGKADIKAILCEVKQQGFKRLLRIGIRETTGRTPCPKSATAPAISTALRRSLSPRTSRAISAR